MKQENRGNYLPNEVHVNPKSVAAVSRKIVGPNIYKHMAAISGCGEYEIDEVGYRKLVKWMEEHDG